jgi:hypothetical protein
VIDSESVGDMMRNCLGSIKENESYDRLRTIANVGKKYHEP